MIRLQHVIRADQFADRELLASLFRAASRLSGEDRTRALPTRIQLGRGSLRRSGQATLSTSGWEQKQGRSG